MDGSSGEQFAAAQGTLLRQNTAAHRFNGRPPKDSRRWPPFYKTLAHITVNGQPEKNAEIQMVVEVISKLHDIVIYTDGSVTMDRSAWGFLVKQRGRTVNEDSGTYRVTICSLTMEVAAITHAIQWLAS